MMMKSESEKATIIVCPPLKGSIRKVLKHLKGKNFQWAYFGEDVSKAITVEHQLGNKGLRIEIGEKLQETARSLWQSYIDYIGKRSLENNSLKWWAGSLSEKNPFISKVFLHICYIRTCQTILDSKDQKGCFIFFIENRTLRRCLMQNLFAHHEYDIFRIESFSHAVFELFRDVSRFVINKGYFVANKTYRILLAKYYRLNQISSKGEVLVFLHTWVDHRSFDANGIYQESYFGELAHHLRNKGKNVALVPYILGTVSYRKTLKKMVQSDENFLVPEAFLNVYDILRIAAKTILDIPPKRVYPLFEGIEISKIISDDYKKDWIVTRTSSNLLFYDVVRNWKNAGIPMDTFIYTYENHTWEKVYCIALRQFYPATSMIGYQHSAIPKMQLNYFFSKDELSILPFPDMVITNGIYPERLFKEFGYDPKKVVCGGAIRYIHLLEEVRKNAVINPKKGNNLHRTVLVTPSIGRYEAAELVKKVLDAFEDMNEYKIMLKFHPVLPYRSIAKDLGVLPKHFIVSDKPVGELLRESDVLLYTSSTTCIEAIFLGIPVLHIASDFAIDRDVLDFQPDIRHSAKNQEDIIKMTEEILETDKTELSKKKALWGEAVSNIFGEVDENVFNLFIQRERDANV